MLSKRSFGIAGAAMLGSVALLGTNAANAAINLNAEDKDPVVFAAETVDMQVQGTDERSYHRIQGNASGAATDDSELDIEVNAGVGATQDQTLRVEFTLSGMVFGSALTADSIQLFGARSDAGALGTEITTAQGGRQIVSGGGVGSSSAVFAINVQTDSVAQDSVIRLRVPVAGVSDMGGGISVTVRNLTLDIEAMASYPTAVSVMQAGTMTATPMNPITYAERGYADFGMAGSPPAAVYNASLGSINIGVADGSLDATDGTDATPADVFTMAGVGDVSSDTMRDTALAAARITFEGMSSFAEFVYLADGDCLPSPETDNRVRDLVERDNGTNNGKLKPVAIADLEGGSPQVITQTIPITSVSRSWAVARKPTSLSPRPARSTARSPTGSGKPAPCWEALSVTASACGCPTSRSIPGTTSAS
jgi:hypothetical protein